MVIDQISREVSFSVRLLTFLFFDFLFRFGSFVSPLPLSPSPSSPPPPAQHIKMGWLEWVITLLSLVIVRLLYDGGYFDAVYEFLFSLLRFEEKKERKRMAESQEPLPFRCIATPDTLEFSVYFLFLLFPSLSPFSIIHNSNGQFPFSSSLFSHPSNMSLHYHPSSPPPQPPLTSSLSSSLPFLLPSPLFLGNK